MTNKSNPKGELKGKARMRAEIVEARRGLHKVGAIGAAELEKTTLRMLGRDALPKVADLSPAEIARVRERAGVSQAVLAGFLNVAVNTVSQWEPTGGGAKAAACRQAERNRGATVECRACVQAAFKLFRPRPRPFAMPVSNGGGD